MPRQKTCVALSAGTDTDGNANGFGGDRVLCMKYNDDGNGYLDGTSDYASFWPDIPQGLKSITTHEIGGRFARGSAWDGTNAYGRVYLRRGANVYSGGNNALVTKELWIDATPETDLGGAPLDDGDAALTEIGAQMVGGGVRTVWTSYVYWDITYTMHGGGYAYIVGCLGPLAAVLLREMPAVAREAWRRSGALILPREYREAWREIRAQKHLVLVG